MNDCRPRSGFSLTELLAAVVILTVVSAATIATVAPMRARAGRIANEHQIAELNRLSQTYRAEHGQFPPNGVVSLIQAGMNPGSVPLQPSALAQILRELRYDPLSGEFSRR